MRLECLWHFWEDLLQDLLQEQIWLDTRLATGVVVVGPLSSLLIKISAQNQKTSGTPFSSCGIDVLHVGKLLVYQVESGEW